MQIIQFAKIMPAQPFCADFPAMQGHQAFIVSLGAIGFNCEYMIAERNDFIAGVGIFRSYIRKSIFFQINNQNGSDPTVTFAIQA